LDFGPRPVNLQAHLPQLVGGDVLDRCLRQIAPSISTDQFINYWFKMDSRIEHQVVDQVAQLRRRGIPVFLATNQEHVRAKYLMNDLKLSQHVDGLIYSAKVLSKKSDQAFFTECEKIVCRSPADLLLVDDTLGNVTAAENAGWRAVHWAGTKNLLDYL